MIKTFSRTSGMLLAIVIVATGCTQVVAGQPKPAPSSAALGPEVPKVERPLTDIMRFRKEPCLTLTAEQVAQLGLPVGVQGYGAGGPTCRWYRQETSESLLIQWVESARDGVGGIYELNARSPLQFFQPMPPIDGKPIVAWEEVDDRKLGSCTLEVGATDDLSFEVSESLPRDKRGKTDPCPTAYEITKLIVETLSRG